MPVASSQSTIVLIGNYKPDRQESMIRFAEMLKSGFQREDFSTEIWWPVVLFGLKITSPNKGVGKWLGYVDKWILFPLVLRWRLFKSKGNSSRTHYHIRDHSNAPYLSVLPISRTCITCHDVLAIRGGMGDSAAYSPASGFGRILQKWIFYHLRRANTIAFVSRETLNQMTRLVRNINESHRNWKVIHNGFNARFHPLTREQRLPLILSAGIHVEKPFLLYVGSGILRKNRNLLLDMVKQLGNRWEGDICYAGEALDSIFRTHAKTLGLEQRIISVIKPDHNTLVALYSACQAFIFPSFSE
ncbi:MAG TPA: glycosyltransferase family 1 protein, partial [Chitinophagaceae bacterium]|nr:glycosyltransferase family 1 protein [Chitinophagaceae bacterium]